MLLHIAGQFPGAIAQGGMGVFFILGKRTGQSLGIRRFLHRLKARIRVLMLQNLDFAADQIAVIIIAARVLRGFIGLVGVENDFFLLTDQLRFGRFCFFRRFGGQLADQRLYLLVALVGVLVYRLLCVAARQFPRCLIAAFGMLMIFFTDQSRRFCVAVIRMHMGRFRRFRTDQFAALHGVAIIRMGMYFGCVCFRHGIAASGVLMGLDLRQRAPKVPIFVIACRIMLVNDKVCIPARQVSFAAIAGIVMLMEIQTFDGTHRLGPGGRGYLRVASLRMGVFRNLTRSLFHGNGGKNQCVDRAEHHNAGKTGYNPVPAFLPLMCLRIFFCALKSILLHIPITSFPISMFRSQAGARPGRQFFQQSVHRRHSQPLYCGNPQK